VSFRQARLTSPFESITSEAYPEPMYSLWTAGVATMLQRLKLFKHLLGIYLNPRQGMALLERVQASNLSDEDRDRVTRIMRATLKLPDAPGHERSAPDAPAPSARASRRRDHHAS